MLTKRCIHSIKKKYLYEVRDGYMPLALLSFAVLLRVKLGDHSCIGHYSVNQVAKITGCSWATCDKYIRQMLSRGLATMDGNTLLLRRLSSGTKHRNVSLGTLDFRTQKKTKYSLRSLMFMLKQNKLDMVKRSIRQAYDPKKHPSKGIIDDFKGARAFCKKYVKPNQFGQYIYRNYGITYETIAKELGCSKQTAVGVINFALKHHWVHKFTHKDVDFIPGVGFQPIEGYTYTTRNYAVKVYANQYKLNSRWYKLLMALQPTFTRKMSRDAVDEYYEKRKLKQNQMREKFRHAVNELAEQYGVDSDFVWKIKGSIDKKRTTLNMIFSLGYPAPLAPTCVANIESKK